MGGLLPIANNDKSGLLSSSEYKILGRSFIIEGKNVYKIIDLSNLTWTRRGFHIMIAAESGSFAEYINCSVRNSNGEIICKTTKLRGNIEIKVLKKDNSIYICPQWNNGTNYSCFVKSFFPITYIGSFDDSYEEMTIDNLQ